jgi:hypothetical protein
VSCLRNSDEPTSRDTASFKNSLLCSKKASSLPELLRARASLACYKLKYSNTISNLNGWTVASQTPRNDLFVPTLAKWSVATDNTETVCSPAYVSTAKHTLQRGANTCIDKNGIRSIKYSVLLLQVCNQTSLTQLRKGLRDASLKLTSISITNGNARCIGKSEF